MLLSLILSDSISGSCLYRGLIQQLNGLDPAIHDIGIYKIGETPETEEAVQEIVDCISEENPVMIQKDPETFISTNNSMRLRKASLFFVVGSYWDFVSIFKDESSKVLNQKLQVDKMDQFFNDSTGLYYWDVYTKFIFLPTDSLDIKNLEKFAWKLFRAGVLNFLVSINDTHHYGYNIFNNQTYRVEMTQDTSEIFPNKLKNLHGYSYRILLYPSAQFTRWKDGKIHGVQIYFLEEMLKHQNATFHVSRNLTIEKATHKGREHELIKNDYDFCPMILQLVHGIYQKRISIETYTMTGYCALIPREPPKSFLVFLVTPFDVWIWILMGLSLLIGTLVYMLLADARLLSAGKFIFGIFGLFLSQSSAIFKPRSRRNVYSQLFIFFAFLFGAIYQSSIISCLFQDRDVPSIKNFQDLKESDLDIIADNFFIYMSTQARLDDKFLKRLQNGNYIDYNAIGKNTALLRLCEIAEYRYNTNKNLSSTFYMLNELIFPFHIQYNTRVSNPFKLKIQDYVLRFMEAGIADYFKQTYARFLEQEDSIRRDTEASLSIEKTILDFDDLFEIYKVLLIGYSAGTVAFVFEWILFLMVKLFRRRSLMK